MMLQEERPNERSREISSIPADYASQKYFKSSSKPKISKLGGRCSNCNKIGLSAKIAGASLKGISRNPTINQRRMKSQVSLLYQHLKPRESDWCSNTGFRYQSTHDLMAREYWRSPSTCNYYSARWIWFEVSLFRSSMNQGDGPRFNHWSYSQRIKDKTPPVFKTSSSYKMDSK